ncbi:uncharacterized protein H6S33_012221 [Morchella sextelata]|uniref:uncharacterized protein n=1 Tax=Morchella sextelata TaxID=1174677 RepID=UPI001D0457D6|nr:uncharacterized protein H6S33_012221 [Morchella sextelata]KAH0610694.1 hypothetical protein H6S33_012221 [Morchella sextelata]
MVRIGSLLLLFGAAIASVAAQQCGTQNGVTPVLLTAIPQTANVPSVVLDRLVLDRDQDQEAPPPLQLLPAPLQVAVLVLATMSPTSTFVVLAAVALAAQAPVLEASFIAAALEMVTVDLRTLQVSIIPCIGISNTDYVRNNLNTIIAVLHIASLVTVPVIPPVLFLLILRDLLVLLLVRKTADQSLTKDVPPDNAVPDPTTVALDLISVALPTGVRSTGASATDKLIFLLPDPCNGLRPLEGIIVKRF